MGALQHIAGDHQVVPHEIRGVLLVGADAPRFSSGDEDVLRALCREERLDGRYIAQIDADFAVTIHALESVAPKLADNGLAEERVAPGDKDPGPGIEPGHSVRPEMSSLNGSMVCPERAS